MYANKRPLQSGQRNASGVTKNEELLSPVSESSLMPFNGPDNTIDHFRNNPRQSRGAGNKKHWLDIYRETMTPESTRIPDVSEHIPRGDMMDAVSVNNAHLPIDFNRQAPPGNTPYLYNSGSPAVGRDVMRQQIFNANIFVSTLTTNNAREFFSELLSKRPAPRGEYLFALSKSRGLRVMAKGVNLLGGQPEAFHHQNIFMNQCDLLSAGTIYVSKKIVVTNFSGHYKPSAESLEHMRLFLIQSGVKKKDFDIVNYLDVGKYHEGSESPGKMESIINGLAKFCHRK